LRENGLARNTLIVFTSDHGDYDGAHRLEHKGLHYEEACRVPLIVAGPNASERGVFDESHLVSNGLDLIPTLCDYAGIAPPEDLQGASLRPLIEGPTPETWREDVPVEFGIGRAIVTPHLKYALYDHGEHRELLIDRANDPGEMGNVIDDPGYAQPLADLRRRLQQLGS